MRRLQSNGSWRSCKHRACPPNSAQTWSDSRHDLRNVAGKMQLEHSQVQLDGRVVCPQPSTYSTVGIWLSMVSQALGHCVTWVAELCVVHIMCLLSHGSIFARHVAVNALSDLLLTSGDFPQQPVVQATTKILGASACPLCIPGPPQSACL